MLDRQQKVALEREEQDHDQPDADRSRQQNCELVGRRLDARERILLQLQAACHHSQPLGERPVRGESAQRRNGSSRQNCSREMRHALAPVAAGSPGA